MTNRFMKRKASTFTFLIMGILLLEVLFLGVFNSFQPSHKSQVIDLVNTYQSPEGVYYNSVKDKQLSLESTYSALSINSILNRSIAAHNDTITNFILSKLDSKTGLFSDTNQPSLEATYSAIGSLSILNRLDEINKTKTIQSILQLQTNDSLFSDYPELNQTNQYTLGEIDHLFEAASILDKLFNNQTEYYLALNRTNIAYTLFSLQSNGGFVEGGMYTTPDMRNAYLVTGIMTKLGPNIGFYESIGFQSDALQTWIKSMYTESGFRMHQASEPSVEATAYAIMSLYRLGLNRTYILSQYGHGIDEMLNYLNYDYLSHESQNTLDTIHDALLAMNMIDIIGKINQPYISEGSQIIFSAIIGLTVLALIISLGINIYLLFKEDEIDYYESTLQKAIKTAFESQGKNLEELSSLLGDRITQLLFIMQEDDENYVNLRAMSANYEYNILYEAYSWSPSKLFKYTLNTTVPLIQFDFLDKEVFYTIEEAVLKLKEAK